MSNQIAPEAEPIADEKFLREALADALESRGRRRAARGRAGGPTRTAARARAEARAYKAAAEVVRTLVVTSTPDALDCPTCGELFMPVDRHLAEAGVCETDYFWCRTCCANVPVEDCEVFHS